MTDREKLAMRRASTEPGTLASVCLDDIERLLDKNEKLWGYWQFEMGSRGVCLIEIERLRAALAVVLASASPHPTEHPTMFAAWQVARAALAKDPEGR